MKRRLLTLVFLLILIFGVALAVILTVVLTSKGNKSEAENIFFFAFYVGNDGSPQRTLRQTRNDIPPQCALNMDIDNTRDTITALGAADWQYSYILYADTSRTIGPFKALDALTNLNLVVEDRNNYGLSQSS
ncbi:unnamed protein product [Strongylus vulgaris]|uniref:Uncharacterized protein n=1 Tax=Strongylus vulgaris TaxID=40348 RepID=A0A3P7LN45_STRVU|nr:unnamed protein product [Strongylus vulgaris]